VKLALDLGVEDEVAHLNLPLEQPHQALERELFGHRASAEIPCFELPTPTTSGHQPYQNVIIPATRRKEGKWKFVFPALRMHAYSRLAFAEKEVASALD
jgi:hypothetical protein